MSCQKDSLRKKMLQTRHALGKTFAEKASRVIQTYVLAWDIWQNARTVGLYAAFADEVATDLLLENAWKSGKTVLLPKIVDKRDKQMIFTLCKSYAGLANGAYGIPEPLDSEPVEIQPELLLVPGTAFDIYGNRMGYGGGYYDRFMGCHKDWRCPLAGLAFSCQVLEAIPHDANDIVMNAICTEKGWI